MSIDLEGRISILLFFISILIYKRYFLNYCFLIIN